MNKTALKLTHGILGNVTDVVLFTLFVTFASVGKQSSYGIHQAFDEAHAALDQLNYKSIRSALRVLKRKKLITYRPYHQSTTLQINQKGKSFLKELLPFYDSNPSWDGRIYIITYDVPETQKQHRELLRQFIKKLGGGMLQKSVWIMFKDPKQDLKVLVEEKNLSGLVIVSSLGQDGSIGEEDLPTLIQRIYLLESINDRYREFLNRVKDKNLPKHILISNYLSIVNDDPQLPHQLLPVGWLGHKAHKLYKVLLPSFKVDKTDRR